MNSESEKKLSMDELMAMNRPTQMAPQPTARELIPPPEVHPTKAEWEEMMDCLYALERHAERQNSYLKKISELPAQLPTRTQMDDLLKRTARLEQMGERAGNRSGKFFSLPKIKLPRPRLPQLDGPTWVVLLMSLAALLLLWWSLGGVWRDLSLLLR